MLKDLSRYAFINAKIRSRIGNIFTEEQFETFRKELHYHDLVRLLAERKYLDADRTALDHSLLGVEHGLFLHMLDSYRKIARWENETDIREFIRVLLQRLEIRNLKDALRIWHKKDEGLTDYVYKGTIVHPIRYDELFSAETYDRILEILKDTPYHDVLLECRDEHARTVSLFPVEVALDRYSYRIIFDNLKFLNRRDGQIVRKFFGLEADLTNFSLLFRFKNYYNLDYKTIRNYLIPYGQKEKRELLAEEIYTKDRISFGLYDLFGNMPDYILKDLDEKMSTELKLRDKMLLVTDLLNEVLSIQISTTLSHYPFTIGIIVVYFLMKEIEVRNLLSVLNMKYYGLTP